MTESSRTNRPGRGRCPKCGWSYAWDGDKCGHCPRPAIVVKSEILALVKSESGVREWNKYRRGDGYESPPKPRTDLVGAGLAVPGIQYLCWEESLCTITVKAQDVFASGFPPAYTRYLVAVEHHWEVP